MTLDDESLIAHLEEFEKLTVKAISPPLEEYLKSVSKTGDTCYNWADVKPLLIYKLERVLDDFLEMVQENGDVSCPTDEEFQATKEKLSGLLSGFYRAPFTVQRLLELLLEPNKHYRKFDKYARGLEKILSVVTTVDPYPKKCPTSLLPNTVLNGNGLPMRSLEGEPTAKRPRTMNGDLSPEETELLNNSSNGHLASAVHSADNTSTEQEALSPDSTTNPELNLRLSPTMILMSPDSTTNDEEEKKGEEEKREEEGKDSEGDCEMKEADPSLQPSENKENPPVTPQNEESKADEDIKQTSLTDILLEHTPSSDA